MLKSLFLDHPNALGESYAQHQRAALSFSLKLFVASVACFLHALVPAWCERTASDMVTRLIGEMRRDR